MLGEKEKYLANKKSELLNILYMWSGGGWRCRWIQSHSSQQYYKADHVVICRPGNKLKSQSAKFAKGSEGSWSKKHRSIWFRMFHTRCFFSCPQSFRFLLTSLMPHPLFTLSNLWLVHPSPVSQLITFFCLAYPQILQIANCACQKGNSFFEQGESWQKVSKETAGDGEGPVSPGS